MTTHILKKHIAGLPFGPGIYRFKDARKRDLYIGKASNLKIRLNSYLKTADARIKKMVESARSLKFVSTESDIEALILESQLIKKFRPRFNIVMRDDKQYSFIVFTGEKYQKILTTHQPQNDEETIGPFTDAGALKTTLRLLRRIFPYCTCKKPHNNFCLNYHIGKCPGVCCLKNKLRITNIKSSHNMFVRTYYENITHDPLCKLREYTKNIAAIKGVLAGKKKSVIKNLEKEMGQLAQKGELEKAIELKNKLSDLKRIFENAVIIKNSDILKTYRSGLESLLKLQKPIIRIEGYDISNIQGVYATGSMVTFVHGQPDKNQYRKFKINTTHIITNTKFQPHHDRGNIEIQNSGDTGMLREIIERRFRHEEWPFPDLILIDGGKGQINAARTAISKSKFLISKQIQNPKFQIPIIGISKNKRHIGHQLIIPGRKTPLPLTKLSPADKNLLLAIDSEAHRFAIGYYRKLHRKSLK